MNGPRLTLLGKPDCHLCHAMRAVAEAVLPEFGDVPEPFLAVGLHFFEKIRAMGK